MSATASFAAVDQALNAWDRMREHRDLVGLPSWGLPDYLLRVFPDWRAILLRRGDAAAAAVTSPGGATMTLPFYWPSALDAAFCPDPDDLEPAADPKSHLPYAHVTDRESAFDLALTSGRVGTDPARLIETLLTDDLTGEPTPPGSVPEVTRLEVEAVRLSAPAPDQAGLGVLLGLRGLTPATGYRRVL